MHTGGGVVPGCTQVLRATGIPMEGKRRTEKGREGQRMGEKGREGSKKLIVKKPNISLSSCPPFDKYHY